MFLLGAEKGGRGKSVRENWPFNRWWFTATGKETGEAINSSSVQTEVVKIGGLQTASISKEIDLADWLLSGRLPQELQWFLKHEQELWEMRPVLEEEGHPR